MNFTVNISQIIGFFLYAFAQIFIMSDLAIFGVFFCFFYIGYILMLPFSVSPINLLLIAFGMGFLIDMPFNSLGQHAATLTLIAFLRPYWLLAIKPQGGYDNSDFPSPQAFGVGWFCLYAGPLLAAHHLSIFSIEAAGSGDFWRILLKAFCSVLLTLASILGAAFLSKINRRP